MTSTWIDCCFIRGGTSKGIFFSASALPKEWDAAFCSAMGSPDPYERQLNGMGGGISSLSKVMVVDSTSRKGFDLEYTFGQVDVTSATVDYAGNCGNLSAGVVPFALESGLITAPDGPAEFRLFNTNTGKTVVVRLNVENGRARTTGDTVLSGVAGTGDAIELAYPNPAGSRTAGLLPTGNCVDTIAGIEATLIDATLPLVIVRAADVGLLGTESPTEIDALTQTLTQLEDIRRAGAVAMGMCETPGEAPAVVPKIALVAPAAESTLLDGTTMSADDVNFMVRVISMGKCHKASPATGAMCLAAAAAVPGTLVSELVDTAGDINIGTPSGFVTAAASYADGHLEETSLMRTARVLMRGQVAVEIEE